MSIIENTKKVKDLIRSEKDRLLTGERSWFYGLFFILAVFLSFGLGRLSKIEEMKEPIKIESPSPAGEGEVIEVGSVLGSRQTEVLQDGAVVASSRGSKYYFPWCSGAKNLSPANKITFSSEEEAKKAGYSLSASCAKK